MERLDPLAKRLKRHSRECNVPENMVQLDYLLSWLLASLAGDEVLGQELVFKGGTALKKCYSISAKATRLNDKM